MKKIAIAVLVIVFAMSGASAFAGGMPGCASKDKSASGSKGKPLSKDPNKGSFQASADHISHWGKSSDNAKQMSLRGNKAELARRRGCPK